MNKSIHLKTSSFDRQLISQVLKEQQMLFNQRAETPSRLGVKREKLSELTNAFERDTKLNFQVAIVISGLRRVGKSTLLLQFAASLKNQKFHYVNFEDERFVGLKHTDLSQLHEVLIHLFGPAQTLLLDEIQVVSGWERWVRRLVDQNYKLIITGSNTELLSGDLGTKLTGRYRKIELLPFSFSEYLKLKNIDTKQQESVPLITHDRALLSSIFESYMFTGGIPIVADAYDPESLRTLFQDIIYRDVIARYKIRAVSAVRELGVMLASNIARPIAYKRLVQPLGLKGVSTVKNHVSRLESAWLFFVLNRYSRSIKQQQLNPKKIFGIDPALMRAVGIETGDRTGYLLENVVFLELRRFTAEIFYYITERGQEIDLFLPRSNLFVQVTFSLASTETRNRELTTMRAALEERPNSRGIILTMHEWEQVVLAGRTVEILPIYEILKPGNGREKFLSLIQSEA